MAHRRENDAELIKRLGRAEFVRYKEILVQLSIVEPKIVALRKERRFLLDRARGRVRSSTGALPHKAPMPVLVLCQALALRQFGMPWYEIAAMFDVSEMQMMERTRRLERQLKARVQ